VSKRPLTILRFLPELSRILTHYVVLSVGFSALARELTKGHSERTLRRIAAIIGAVEGHRQAPDAWSCVEAIWNLLWPGRLDEAVAMQRRLVEIALWDGEDLREP
jgi:hypothetical protein